MNQIGISYLGRSVLNRNATAIQRAARHRTVPTRALRATAALALLAIPISLFPLPATAATFSNPAPIAIPSSGAGSLYPSTITTAGLTGTVTSVSVRLNQMSHTWPDDVDILLVGPGGQKILLMSDAGGNPDLNGVTLTFADSAPATLPNNTQIVSGTFKPSNFSSGDAFPAPAPGPPYSTLLSIFNGTDPNGLWSLFVVDDDANDLGTISGGWDLIVTSATVNDPPSNTPPAISAIASQTTATNTTTPPIPFTVGDAQTPVANLVVSGVSSNQVLVPNANLVFSGTGTNRSLTATPAAEQTGTTWITVTVTDSAGASASTGFLLTVSGQATSGTFANTASITIPGAGPASVYPSSIAVTGLAGAISKVTVKLNQVSHTWPDDIDILLVSAAGQKVLLMSDAGGSGDINNLILTLDDAAASTLSDSGQLISGTYKPSNVGTGDGFASPAPAGPYVNALTAFNGGNPNGTWSLYVIDDEANDAGSIVGGWSLSITTSTSPGTPPANDAFASAQAISGNSGTVSGSTGNATKQAGEPNHAGNPGGASVWYAWTPQATGLVTFDTAQSDFNTLLAVYTGAAVDSLALIASSNDIDIYNTRSRVQFTATAGTAYKIAVDGADGARGSLKLRWNTAATALPDLVIFGTASNPYVITQNFSAASCAVVEGYIQSGTRKIIRFNTETANQGAVDLFFGNPVNNTLFEFASCHAHYHFKNYIRYILRNASGQATVVGMKIGSCILDSFRWDPNAANNPKYDCGNQGIQKGWGDLYDSSLDGQWIDITGVPDGTYTLEMEANPLGIIQEANYANNFSSVPIVIGNPGTAPANDNFASAQTLSGGAPTVTGNTLNATRQSGEPNHAGNAGGHSVWYQWTAPSSGPVTIDTIGSGFDTLLGVYTGTSVSALSLVASNDNLGSPSLQSRVSFTAVAGTIYRIAVDGFNGLSGSLVLTVNQTLANDLFGSCLFIGGGSGTVFGSTAGATKEAGEPAHAGNAGGHSIWYCWTAPMNGTVAFDTLGSTFDTLLAVYTGDTVSALVPVAANDDISPGNTNSQATFSAVSMTMYHIAVDGFDGASGNTTLHWNMAGARPSLAQGDGLTAPLGSLHSIINQRFLPEGAFQSAFQIVITGPAYQFYRIERSADLVTWNTVASTLADMYGMAYFTDKSALEELSATDAARDSSEETHHDHSEPQVRFYRAMAVLQN